MPSVRTIWVAMVTLARKHRQLIPWRIKDSGLRDAYANSSFLGQSLSALMSARLPTSGGTVDILGAHPHAESTTLAQHFLAGKRATAVDG